MRGGVGRIFTSQYWSSEHRRGNLYRPLTIATFRLNYRVGGLNPYGYHLVNILLHATVTVLVFMVSLRMAGRPTAAAAGLLFAAHPVHVEAVANVVGRAEILAAVFVLAAWFWRDRTWLALLLFALGLLSKENAVVLPALLVIEDLVRSGPRLLVRRYLPFLILLVLFLALRTAIILPQLSASDSPFAGVPAQVRILTVIQVLGMYLAMLLWPTQGSMAFYDQLQLVVTPFDLRFWAWTSVVFLCGAGAWLLRRRMPVVCAGAVLFIVALAPVSNLLFGIGVIMAERLLYLPSVGACLALGALMEGTILWLGPVAARRQLTVACFITAIVPALAMGARSWIRSRDWADSLTLYRATAASAPNSPSAQAALCSVLEEIGQHQEAEEHCRRSLAANPANAEAHFALGTLLDRTSRTSEGMEHYLEAIRPNPGYRRAYNNLGIAYEKQGDLVRAEAAYRRAAELSPDRPGPRYNLAAVLERSGRIDEAIVVQQEAVRLEPRNEKTLVNLGRMMLTQNRVLDPIESLKRALAIDPGSALAAANLAAAYLQQGDFLKAESFARQSLERNPSEPLARRVLDLAQRRLGDQLSQP